MPPKEATVYIVDVGRTMGRRQNGRDVTNLEWSMQYVWDRINATVMAGKKTEMLGVLALRSDTTKHRMGDEEGYSNISVVQDIQQTLLPDVLAIKEKICPSKTGSGDILSAVIVAIDMIEVKCRKLLFDRNIVLVTDGLGALDDDDVQQTIDKIKSDNISLTVLGVDFDDLEYGFKEEDKDPTKAKHENILRNLTDACHGVYGTMAEAIGELGLPRIKQPHPTPLFSGDLTLGDPAKYDTALKIPVQRFAYVRVAKAPSASNYVIKTDGAASMSTHSSATIQNSGGDGGLAAVKQARTYVVDDENAPNGKRELERDELAKGYEYGRTAVPMEDQDKEVTKLKTFESCDIVGFVAAEDYKPWMGMSETNQIIASKVNKKAAFALSSLIHALQERDMYAVARLVTKNGKDPVMILMAPYMEPDYECLIDVELPFAEDIRSFTFPPLDRVVTVGGKHIKQHRNLPNEALVDAMSKYVDAMDISAFGKDEQGKPVEYALIPETFNMRKNYVEQAIKTRALNPEDPPPAPYPILSKYSHPPEELLKQARPTLEALIEASNVKRVPPKLKGRKRGRDVEKPLSGLDVDKLLQMKGTKRIKISPDNAIPEFIQALSHTTSEEDNKEAVRQLGIIITNLIKDSTGTLHYQRAAAAMRVMRQEMVDLEEPEYYNAFLGSLKEKLIKGELNGDRREMWFLVKSMRLGLIDNTHEERSNVTPEEAREFLSFM